MNFLRLSKNDLPQPEGSQVEHRKLATQEEVLQSNALQNQLDELEAEHGSNLIQRSIIGGDGFNITDVMMEPL